MLTEEVYILMESGKGDMVVDTDLIPSFLLASLSLYQLNFD